MLDSAAAQTPGGVDNFRGEGGFHCAFRSEVFVKTLTEELVEADFVRTNEVAGGIDAEDGGSGGVGGHGRSFRESWLSRFAITGCLGVAGRGEG